MSESPPGKIRFDFIKSNLFRVVHADGVFGGPTPQRHLAISFFNERAAIPRQTTNLLVNGVLGDEVIDARVVRDAVVREVEVCVLLNPEVAGKLYDWLGRHIEQMKTLDEKSDIKGQ